jgi:hypothetical protein
LQIAAAFSMDRSSHTFSVAETLAVQVTVTNPGIAPADYGDYLVTLKAQAIGAGIGTGSGARFTFSLRPASATDTVPPTVTINQPAADQILGPVALVVTAVDPTPGTGVNALTTTISSAGGTISALPIAMSLDETLPVAAGTPVTGTGSFSPTGGTGGPGTTEATAFTAAARSGIGTYTLTAHAADLAGNVGTAATTFAIKYDIQFSNDAPPPCATGGPGTCTGRVVFTVRRSSTASDGAFMLDQSVKVELVASASSQVKATHVYGTGDVKDVVQIDPDPQAPKYKTSFRRSDFGASGPTSYVVKVYFRDVDGQWMLQATSAALVF